MGADRPCKGELKYKIKRKEDQIAAAEKELKAPELLWKEIACYPH